MSRNGAFVMDFVFLLFITFNIEIASSFVILERVTLAVVEGKNQVTLPWFDL